MAVPRREDSPAWWRTPQLTDRRAERQVLDSLIKAVRAGRSRALVVHGEPGIGKTALLEYLAGQASRFRIAHAAGVQSEMELAFAGLHQLCAPMLDHLAHLPAPQRDALQTAFGMSAGSTPDRFLIGLAVLSLRTDVIEKPPLPCLVDDAQWLDHASAQVLAFVARRLGAESVGLVFGIRFPSGDLEGLPALVLDGLPDADARLLLDAVLTGPIDARVRDQIVAETRGNPLALLELPRGLTAVELAGGFGLLGGTAPLSGSIEESFRRRSDTLPADTRRVLLLAAADPTGDPALVYRAAARLEIGTEAAAPAIAEGLVEFGTRVRFRHPLVRSAAYRSAPTGERQQVHRALAEATDARLDPDRRAGHRAQAATAPDEDVAAELERSAGRAQARGGLAAAAAFLQRAAALTLDPAQRAARALAAAQAEIQTGGFDAAQDLLAMAEAEPLSDLDQARADLVPAQLAYVTNRGNDAAPLLLKAAARLAAVDVALSVQPTWTRCPRRSSPAASPDPGGTCWPWRAPRARRRHRKERTHPISCLTARPPASTTGTQRECPCCVRPWPTSAPGCPPRRSCACCGWPPPRRSASGTTSAGRRSPPATSSSSARPARSANSRLPSPYGHTSCYLPAS